jgi:hybrid cluster-associated redox disulfide protein
MPVDEIMRRWPATIRPFLHHRMLCVGCPIGVFHTVADACEAHGVDRDVFEVDLLAATRAAPLAEPSAAGGEAPAARDPSPRGRCGPR